MHTSLKTKIILGALALAALVSVGKLLDSIGIPVAKKSNTADVALQNPEQDADFDGLTNEEESQWETDFQNPDTDGDGFRDGEEVASGHDPRIPGPNDELLSDTSDLSDRLANLVAAGLFDGSLTSVNTDRETSISDVIDDVLSQVQANTAITPTKPLIVENTIKNRNLYAIKVDEMFRKLPTILESAGTDTDFQPQPALGNLQAVIHELELLKTPRPWAKLHADFVDTLKTIAKSYELLDAAERSQDNVQIFILLNDLEDLVDQLIEFRDAFQQAFATLATP